MRKTRFIRALLPLLVLLCPSVRADQALAPNAGQLRSISFEELLEGFAEPDMLYGPFLYWFWDEPIDRAKIREMTHQIVARGFNPGYLFAHISMADLLSRTPGLEDRMAPHPSLPNEDWLSETWFDAVEDVVSIAESAGAYVTYADDYMWPSGRADGRVIKAHPELASANLDWEVTDLLGGTTADLPASFFTVAAQTTGKVSEFVRPVSVQTFELASVDAEDLHGRTSVGQTVKVDRLRLHEISIAIACWRGVSNSGFTLQAREGGPGGRIIAAREFPPGLREGELAALRIPEMLPVGTVLYVEALPGPGQARETMGWWSKRDDVYDGGTAYVNGQPSAGDRFVKLSYLTRPESMSGKWIWQRCVVNSPHRCWFRKHFTLDKDAEVLRATMQITADNGYTLYINGSKVGSDEDWPSVESYAVDELLSPGNNVIAVEATGAGQPEALLCDLKIDLSDGRRIVVESDESWRVSEVAVEDWWQPDLDDNGWEAARVVAPVAFCPPWNLADAKKPYVPATIRSDTLRLIGAGEPFSWTAPAGGNWRVYTFVKTVGGDVSWLDHRLASAFIEIAHKPYAEHFGERMGGTIPGAICDTEGGYGFLAWSDSLVARYRANTGRDIRLWMPLMIDHDLEGLSARARFDWFEAVSDLYSGYFAEVSDWLAARGMYYISNVWEESLQWETRCVSDFMKVQRAFSMPGMDALGMKAYDVHDFKETQSVAAFEGRRYECEYMGAGGWDTFNMVSMKEGINATTAWGASHIVPHALFMARKQQGNVWVPDWYDENPWWPYVKQWADFVRRVCYVNSHGNVAPDVLLLTPLDSVWAILGNAEDVWGPDSGNVSLLDGLFDRKIQETNRVYSDAIRQLAEHRVEYLIADRHYMRQMKLEGATLVRGEFRFGAMVLPPMVVMPLDVARKIVGFAKAGGHVYRLGELPTGSTDNGFHDPEMKTLMRVLQAQPTVRKCTDGLARTLAENHEDLTSPIQFVSGTFPMLQLHRRIGGCDFFWLANNSGEPRECEVRVAGARGAASVWNCETGDVQPIASVDENDGSRTRLAFQPHEGYWLAFDPRRPPHQSPAMTLPRQELLVGVEGSWNVRIDPAVQPNLEHKVKIPAAFTSELGVSRELTPWDTWEDLPDNFSGLIDYTKTVELPVFEGKLTLSLGEVWHFAEVWVNGVSLGAKLWPPHSFQTEAFRPGDNTIRIRVGNLVNNNYGMASPSGLIGPVRVLLRRP